MSNENNEVLEELMGISGIDDRERQKIENAILSSIKKNQLKAEEAEEE